MADGTAAAERRCLSRNLPKRRRSSERLSVDGTCTHLAQDRAHLSPYRRTGGDASDRQSAQRYLMRLGRNLTNRRLPAIVVAAKVTRLAPKRDRVRGDVRQLATPVVKEAYAQLSILVGADAAQFVTLRLHPQRKLFCGSGGREVGPVFDAS